MMFNDMYASIHSATFDNKYDHFHGDDMMMMMIKILMIITDDG